MKKILSICLVIVFMFALSGTTLALTNPRVAKDHGTITGMLVSDTGLKLSGEYGITSQTAIIGTIGGPSTRIGAKYQVGRNLSMLIGVTDDSPWFGVNGSKVIDRDLTGIYEINASMRGDDLSLLYELGLKLDIDSDIDLQAGLIGFINEEEFPDLELGMGYKF